MLYITKSAGIRGSRTAPALSVNIHFGRMNAIYCLFLSHSTKPSDSNCGYSRACTYRSYSPETLKFASSQIKRWQLSSWFSYKVFPNKLWKQDWGPTFFSFLLFPFFFSLFFFLFNKTMFMMVDKTFLSSLLKALTTNQKMSGEWISCISKHSMETGHFSKVAFTRADDERRLHFISEHI